MSDIAMILFGLVHVFITPLAVVKSYNCVYKNDLATYKDMFIANLIITLILFVVFYILFCFILIVALGLVWLLGG